MILESPILPQTPGKGLSVKFPQRFSYLPPELTDHIVSAPEINVSKTVPV
ncbi:MAG: hypothetical protein ACPHY8_01020 [Patescibacteria group bacterium]